MKVTARKYHKSSLTPAKKKFVEVYARTDNASYAVKQAFDNAVNMTEGSIREKASTLLTNPNVVNHIEYQKNKLEQLATKAVNRVEQLIDSDNENVATMNTWKTIEQVQGKALSRSINANIEANVSDVISKLT